MRSFKFIRKQQKRIINGKQRQKSESEFYYQWELRGDFDKKHKKKWWKCYMQGWFWITKKKDIRGFLNKLFKNVQISPIHKADYFSTFDFKVCVFFLMFLSWNLGQVVFLQQILQKYTHAEKAKNLSKIVDFWLNLRKNHRVTPMENSWFLTKFEEKA